MQKNRFPRIWVPSPKIAICGNCVAPASAGAMRTRIMNQLQALAMNEGQRWKHRWSAEGRAVLEKFPLAPWASRRRQDLLSADHRNARKVPTWQADRQLYWALPEDSSGGRQRLGHISKQGNALLRFLLVEAAQAAVRCNQDWRQKYWHLAMRREKARWRWVASWPCGCTGCGARVGHAQQ